MLWVWAPPSDHDHHFHLPWRFWGDGALTVFLEPTMTVRVNGVTALVRRSEPSVRPDGCDAA